MFSNDPERLARRFERCTSLTGMATSVRNEKRRGTPHRENRVRGERVPIRVRMVRNHLLYEGTGSLVCWILEVGQEIIHGDTDASAKLLTKSLSHNCCSRGRARRTS
jgi:hypothetical protein